jgi:hypothetical protein
MKISALAAALLCAIVPVTGCATSRDFDNVVSTIEQHYAVHAQRVPMMGFVSFCAWGASRGGVKGMRIAEFDNLTLGKSDDLSRLMREKLGDRWQPFVTEREAGGQQDVIYVQPDGDFMRMFIADYDGNELNLVRLDLNGKRLQKWMRDPARSARSHDYTGKNRQPE